MTPTTSLRKWPSRGLQLPVPNAIRLVSNSAPLRAYGRAQRRGDDGAVLREGRGLCALLHAPRRTTLRLLINPERPGRWEPRKLKRRLKQYDLLKEPRQNLKAKHRARCG